MDEFGGAVRRARSLKGWQLKQLSDKMDGSSGISFLSDIEKGKRAISPPTVGKLIAALELDEGWIDRFLTPEEPNVDDEVTEQDRRTDQLLSAVAKEGDAGIAEGLLITLAKEYAEGETTDLSSAYKGLQMALQTARDMAARAAMPDNADAGMAAVRAEVQRLNEAEDVEGAGAAIDEALAQQKAQMSALLDLALQQDRLRNNPMAAAKRLVDQLRLEVGEVSFEALRALQDEWYEHGLEGGSAYDAEVAIYIAEISLVQAPNADKRCAALNDLGIALSTLGEREAGTARLEGAVIAYKQILMEYTREHEPLEYAATQNNLGNALQSIGEREEGSERLLEAVAAYRIALLEYSRDVSPLDWAMTQNNLGSALSIIGERETGTQRLDEAVTAFRDALCEYSREREPLDWAMTQNNLGNALSMLGEREKGYERLVEAVKAYQNALLEWTRDEAPFSWAVTQHCLSGLSIAFFDKTSEVSHLDTAVESANAALEVYLEKEATHYIEWIEGRIEEIKSRRP